MSAGDVTEVDEEFSRIKERQMGDCETDCAPHVHNVPGSKETGMSNWGLEGRLGRQEDRFWRGRQRSDCLI